MSILSTIKELIEKRDVPALKKALKENNLKVEGNKIVPVDDKDFRYWLGFWDQRQQARKILLNVI